MAYSIKTFYEIHELIVQEIRNSTGLTVPFDSDASIRADGTASVVEGLYHHQAYIQKQLFIATADEPYLYIHAEELGSPRLGGTQASGTGTAISNVDLTIVAGSKVTDGKGHYWSVVSDVVLIANVPATINFVADQVGASWNTSSSLIWISPAAGLNGTVTDVSIGGGSDEEELEDWRARLLERKQLGLSRDRQADLVNFMKAVTGVQDVYVYPKRRGLGSVDVAITAVGNPPTLPSQALLDAAQTALDEYAGFWADCKVYSPTEQLVPVSAIVAGVGVNLNQVEQVIRDYFAELAPAESYQASVLVARIIALPNVTDVTLTPSSNIVPTVDWMHTYWLRLGTLSVSAA
ncbi:baseplate J/gp47 family protein [Acinetobacter sp. VNH17]|uniref:Baseplate J/gp47 family protein n=1 Tax=Acinetobacter thutiue TaxID=2998078 RepID=A0ABT7WN37_9GAMM|nr:baseplate J/gp47 family protein [Acinetobacter thutiue]MCY6411997.1 baseplate J/gp47 family protein [Acinetobacter thutiue]MDN0014101.1 baseplate J/gp47 family protein [Acinetobacter thutiue]